MPALCEVAIGEASGTEPRATDAGPPVPAAVAGGGLVPAETADAGLSDSGLVNRVRAGERDAFAVLVRRHAAVARRTAVLLGAGADADDVVQEALVKAYRALGGFRDGAEFRPWLLRIVANETRNAQRSGRRRADRERSPAAVPHALLPGAAVAVDPAERALAGERLDRLWRQVRALPEPQRQILVCRFLLDLDEAETAEVLGLSRGTVKSRTHRALRRLRALVDTPPADPREEAGRG